jgi:hypothetical protein
MENKEIFDETFDPNRSESYTLSVQVSLNGISFCINDTVRDIYISFVSFPFSSSLSINDEWGTTIGQFFSQFDVISRKFKRILLSFDSHLFTVVPTEFFTPEKAKQLFELVHPLPNLYEVRYNSIAESKSTIIFAIPSSLTAQWLFRQPQTQFIGHPAPLIALSSLAKPAKEEPSILAQFSEQFFINVISKNKELLHCNSFNYYDTNDTAYHLVNTCKLLDIEPSKSEIVITGSLINSLELESLLAQYFSKVTSNHSIDSHNYSYSIAKYKNSYWNLFNLSLCE